MRDLNTVEIKQVAGGHDIPMDNLVKPSEKKNKPTANSSEEYQGDWGLYASTGTEGQPILVEAEVNYSIPNSTIKITGTGGMNSYGSGGGRVGVKGKF